MAKALTDQQVAAYLSDFRERPQADQEKSPIWQELISFAGWGMATFKPDKTPPEVTPEIPDPRMAAPDRAKIIKKQEEARVQGQVQGQVTDDAKGKKPNAGAMTTAGQTGGPNPWADYKEPGEGFCMMGVQTEVPPPFKGKWERIAEGWVRRS